MKFDDEWQKVGGLLNNIGYVIRIHNSNIIMIAN